MAERPVAGRDPVHPTAEVDPGAVVADGVTIGMGSYVGDGSRIGEGTVIGRWVLVDAGVELAEGVQIHHGARLYGGSRVEEGVLVGPGAVLTNDRYPRAITSTVEAAAAIDEADGILVRRGASIGAGAIVVSPVEVGRFALVAAGAVVTRPVPAHALVGGNPARRLGWVCACGARLVTSDGDPAPAEPAHYALDSALHCPSCGRVYTYVPDEETVREQRGPRQDLPA